MKVNFHGLFDSDRVFLEGVGFTNIEDTSADIPEGWCLYHIGHDAVLMDPQGRVRADLIERRSKWVIIPRSAFKIRENSNDTFCETIDMRRYGSRPVIVIATSRKNAEDYLDHFFPDWKNPVTGWWHESD